MPNKNICAFFLSFTITEDKNISKNATNINQKVPRSKIVPKKDVWGAEENEAESKNTKTTASPERITGDRGRLIFPSENLATAQKITETAKPPTKSSPLEVSTGILVKGKKKTGNKITTTDKEIKETLSKIFDHIKCVYCEINKL